MWKSMAVAFIVLSVSTVGQTVVAGELPAELRAGEHRLVLNGEGSRTKAFLEMYVAGLYLTQPSSDAALIVADDKPMAIRIKITSSFVSQKSLVDSLEDGFKAATGGNTNEIRKQIDEFRGCFKEAISKGDVIDLVYLPQHGVIVNKNGKFQSTIQGTKFKQALFGIWLSNQPADANLKQAMLAPRNVR